jgi:NAD(P)-dependent dehydrogenase (short-subunit alcohol dehydrogenase family)
VRRFGDKVCIVTGAASGIGRATAGRLAAEGGRVLVVDLDVEQGRRAVEAIVSEGGVARFVGCDVSDSAQVRYAVKTAVDAWGRVDVLVNNAAMMTFRPAVELEETEWDRVMAVNVKSVFMFCKYAAPHMPEESAVVNTSSVHAHASEPGVAPYAASKGAVEAFTRVLALELGQRRIRVNCVAPGAIDTPMLWNNPYVKSGKEKIEGAVGKPEDIAAAICFLASGEARFVNGTTLIADGSRLDML